MNPIQFLADIMMQVLNFFYSLSGNYGIAIILLTVAVKIALYPLTLQSTQQMQAMQKLQPKLEEIQKRHKGKPQDLQKETLDLYRTHGVNPLGGCLPLLLQIPFFIALFVVLTSKEFTAAMSQPGIKSTFIWIANLAKPDHTYIMVALIGLTTYWSQKTMPGAKAQQQMMLFMPFFIAFVSAPFPAGVQLYWVVSNLLTVLQQWYILKQKA